MEALNEASLIGMPAEVIRNMMSFMTVSQILNLCETSKQFNQFCNDENFWMEKLKANFGINAPVPGKTWKQSYIDVATNTIRKINIVSTVGFLGERWVSLEDVVMDVAREVGKERGIEPRFVSIIYSSGMIFGVWEGKITSDFETKEGQFFSDFDFTMISTLVIADVDSFYIRVERNDQVAWIPETASLRYLISWIRAYYPNATYFYLPSFGGAVYSTADNPFNDSVKAIDWLDQKSFAWESSLIRVGT